MSRDGTSRPPGPPAQGGHPDPDPDPGTGGPAARDEAEKLVAAALGTASVALRTLAAGSRVAELAATRDAAGALGGTGAVLRGMAGAAQRLLGDATSGHSLATNSAECCVCPVCRLIRALRDPSPELALRAATTAGDLATGLATALRALNDVASSIGRGPAATVPERSGERGREAPVPVPPSAVPPSAVPPSGARPSVAAPAPVRPPDSRFTPDEIWQAATRIADSGRAAATGAWPRAAADLASPATRPDDAGERARLREEDPWRAATHEYGAPDQGTEPVAAPARAGRKAAGTAAADEATPGGKATPGKPATSGGKATPGGKARKAGAGNRPDTGKASGAR